MPLDRYNQLILENKRLMDALDNIVKIEADWNNEPSLKIDLSVLAAGIREKFEQSEFTGKWTMEDVSKHKETVWGVFKRIEHDEDEENQAQPLGFLFGFQCSTVPTRQSRHLSAAQLRLTEAVRKTVDSITGLRLTAAAHKTVDAQPSSG